MPHAPTFSLWYCNLTKINTAELDAHAAFKATGNAASRSISSDVVRLMLDWVHWVFCSYGISISNAVVRMNVFCLFVA